nr:MAG TPA_asm: hypothetical protein [Caudoviricetes sp.]
MKRRFKLVASRHLIAADRQYINVHLSQVEFI